MNVTINKNSILILVVFIMTVGRYLFGFEIYLPIYMLVSVYLSLFYLVGFSSIELKLSKLKLFFVFAFAFSVIFYLLYINSNTFKSVFFIFNFLTMFLLAYFYWEARAKKSYKDFLLIFYIYVLIVFANIIFNGRSPDDMDKILYESSRNVVSGIAIVIYSTILYVAVYFRKKVSLFHALILLGVCLVSYARSGILLGTILFLITLVYSFNFKGFLSRVVYFALTILVVTLTIPLVIDFIVNNTNFQRGFESIRLLFLMEYIENLNYKTLLFGVDVNKTPLIGSFDGNPHNSFLYMHSLLGAIAFLWLLIVILGMAKLVHSGKLIELSCLAIIIARASLDITFFMGSLDFFTFIILISIYRFKKVKNLPSTINYKTNL